MFARAGRILQHLRITQTVPRVCYRRHGPGRGTSSMRGRAYTREDAQAMIEEVEMDEEENVESWIDVEDRDHRFKDDLAREEEKFRRKVLFKILEKKYFKKPQEVNFLTWDAKEQIRYLHGEYPEEWTIDKLAESFPITSEGVIKILNSKFSPRTVQDIIKHDEKVKRNWLFLDAGGSSSGGPIVERYKHLLESGKLHTLKNAAGIQSLPMPQKYKLLSSESQSAVQQAIEKSKSRESGLFESIVRDYWVNKHGEGRHHTEGVHRQTDKTLAPTLMLANHTADNAELLQSVTSSEIMLSQKSANETIHEETLRNTMKSKYQESFTYNDSNLRQVGRAQEHMDDFSELQTLLDVDFDVPRPNPHDTGLNTRIDSNKTRRKPLRHGRRKLTNESTVYNPEELDIYGMKDTYKVGKAGVAHHQSVDDKTTAFDNEGTLDHTEYENVRNYSLNYPENIEIMNKMQYDSSNDNEPYLYDTERGYQFPFGRPDKNVGKLQVHQKSKPNDRSVSVLYKKGNNYYDENGEFLYKVP